MLLTGTGAVKLQELLDEVDGKRREVQENSAGNGHADGLVGLSLTSLCGKGALVLDVFLGFLAWSKHRKIYST
ncbi:hypothetical protein BDV11DRAFT_190530 [Aspergillus similis]